MKKYNLLPVCITLIFFFACFTNPVTAQEKDYSHLLNKWSPQKSIINHGSLSDIYPQNQIEFIELRADGTYQAINLGEKMTGNWSRDRELLTLWFGENQPNPVFQIKALGKDHLTLETPEGKSPHIMLSLISYQAFLQLPYVQILSTESKIIRLLLNHEYPKAARIISEVVTGKTSKVREEVLADLPGVYSKLCLKERKYKEAYTRSREYIDSLIRRSELDKDRYLRALWFHGAIFYKYLQRHHSDFQSADLAKAIRQGIEKFEALLEGSENAYAHSYLAHLKFNLALIDTKNAPQLNEASKKHWEQYLYLGKNDHLEKKLTFSFENLKPNPTILERKVDFLLTRLKKKLFSSPPLPPLPPLTQPGSTEEAWE